MTDTGTAPSANQLGLVALMRDLLRATTEDELYELIGEWSVNNLLTGRASVTRREGDWVRVLSVSGPSGFSAYSAGDLAPLPGTAVDHVLRSGETYLWNVAADDRGTVAAALAAAGLHAIVAAPVRENGTITGTFNVATESPSDLTPELIDATQEIAEFLSVNLDRLRLQNELNDELERSRTNAVTLERINDLAVDLSAVDDEQRVLDIVAKALSLIVRADRVSLSTPIPGTDRLRLAGLLADTPDPIGPGEEVPMAGSANGEVFTTGRPLTTPDMATSPFPELRRLAERGLQSGVSVPVPIDGKVGAVLNCGSFERFELDEDELDAVRALAGLTGASLERIRAQRFADRQSERMRVVVDESPLLIMTVGADKHVARMSRFAAERLGYDREQWVDASVGALYTDADRASSERRIDELMVSPVGTVSAWTSRMRDAAGDEIPVRHTGRRLNDDELSREASVLLVCEDVSELQALSDKLEHQANHDPLTGLVNRREFDRRLARAAEDADGPISLCFIDIDRFKLINDTAGHHAGDDLLVEIADVLQRAIANTDTLARIGGDEFALVLEQCALPDAVRVAERLRSRASSLAKTWGGRTFPVSLSIGVAAYDPQTGVDTLVTDADAACYAAKSAGRDRVSVATAAGDAARRRDGEWVSCVQHALRHGGLRLAAQRIERLSAEESTINFEILVRLVDGDDLVPAGVFIPPTERYGLITELDRWVVSEVVSVLAEQSDLIEHIGFCTINLSAKSIENEDFLEFLLDLLADPQVPTERLIFELTETTALSQFATAVRFIESVAALGCRFALDDFGAGFSTYQYLKQLPVHILKIDGSLVRDVTSDPINREIVHSMAQVASAIGMETVAEFVEDQATSTLLSGLGVDYAQGYGIGRPVMLDDILDELRSTPR